MFANRPATFTLACAAASLALLAGCGSGGGSAATSTPPPGSQGGGIQGTGGFAKGAITGFGSIFVNGVEFRTTSASITVNGQSASEAQLKIGQVVVVNGTIDSNGTTGTASSVTFDSDVRGQVGAVDAAAGSFTVLGQTVATDGETTFDGVAGLSALVAGVDFVEVSGFRDAQGTLHATHVEKIGTPSEVEVDGRIGAIDTAAKTFTIGQITVDYSGATTLNNFSAPAAGQEVEARGSLVNGVLKATRVDGKGSESRPVSGAPARLEGFVTRFASATDFDVNGLGVTTDASTQFTSTTPVALGARVEVEGSANSTGTILATKVRVRDSGAFRVAGTVASIDASNSRFTVFGVEARVSAYTRYDDQSTAAARPFGLAQLHTGDYVEVRGGQAGGSSIDAGVVVRENAVPAIELRGTASSIDSQQLRLTVLGLQVRLASGAQCQDLAAAPVDCTTLLGGLTSQSVVTARDSTGTASSPSGGLVADFLKLEN
jgi:hypothetical protein